MGPRHIKKSMIKEKFDWLSKIHMCHIIGTKSNKSNFNNLKNILNNLYICKLHLKNKNHNK